VPSGDTNFCFSNENQRAGQVEKTEVCVSAGHSSSSTTIKNTTYLYLKIPKIRF